MVQVMNVCRHCLYALICQSAIAYISLEIYQEFFDYTTGRPPYVFVV